MSGKLPPITGERRWPSPVVTPQALAWDGRAFWLSSRDLGTLHRIDPVTWRTIDEIDPPGIVWAAVATKNGWRFTVGKGLNDDRYVYSYTPEAGFRKLFACPEFAGSYLSFDGEHLYLSQWYKGLIHQIDEAGAIRRTIEVGEETCGHTFVDGMLYILRGHEKPEESWRIGRLDLQDGKPQVEDLASVPFASRSLAFDGTRFFSNHRAGHETVAFTLP
ncbi:hypothetical protein BH20VER1_BH20VER1_23250 [soil metagenome]